MSNLATVADHDRSLSHNLKSEEIPMELADNFSQFAAVMREPLFVVLAVSFGTYAILWFRVFRRTGTHWPVERPTVRTKTRKVPIHTLARHAIEGGLHPEPKTLTVPGFHAERLKGDVYAGRDYVPLRLRSGN